MEGEQVEFALLPKYLGGPVVLLRGGFDLAQNGADVNRLAVVTAVIFAEPFHAENFTQKREDAKKFLTRLSRLQFFKARRAGIFVDGQSKTAKAP